MAGMPSAKALFEDAAARRDAIERGLFIHFTNVSRADFESADYPYCLNGPFVIDAPRGTATFSAETLQGMGMAGIYRRIGDQAFDALDLRMYGRVRDAYGTRLVSAMAAFKAGQAAHWGWPALGAPDLRPAYDVAVEDHVQALEESGRAGVVTIKPQPL